MSNERVLSDHSLESIQRMSACLSVLNLEKSVEWYMKVLGFRPFLEKDFTRYGAKVVYMERGEFQIELVKNIKCIPERSENPPLNTLKQGISQITFRVGKIEQIYTELKSAGVEIAMGLREINNIKVKAFFIRDCEGNLIEFLEMD